MDKRHVLPATGMDGDTNGYTGIVPSGQLLALPKDLDITKMRPLDWPLFEVEKKLDSRLRDHRLSREGAIIAKALQDHGAYVVDTAGATVLFAEPGIPEATLDEVRKPYDDKSHSELKTMVANLSCVSNNAGPSWGGGGVPRRDPAPPFR